ncbi:hypothetical protein KJ708_04375 [bacterium]|nr:hypothetical protein [bacterium]
MKKTLFVTGMALAVLFVINCGGGSDSAPANADESTSAPETLGVITINAVEGNGSAEDIFYDSLIVTGSNFTEDMVVSLDDDELSYSCDSDTQITANLPTELKEGNYSLLLMNATSSASTDVSLLQGEPGADGISIEAQYNCGASNDVGSSTEYRFGLSANVTQFSDGSFHISCMANAYLISYGFWDTSSDSRWYAYDSSGVGNGQISCVPMYVTANYDIDANKVVYTNQDDTTKYSTVTCSKVYP